MLPEALVALAASGGAAVVTAAGTDAWIETKTRVAQLLGRDGQEEETVLQRLDQTAADLEQASTEDGQPLTEVEARLREEWTAQLLRFLTDHPEARDELGSVIGSARRSGATYGGDHIEISHNTFQDSVIVKKVGGA